MQDVLRDLSSGNVKELMRVRSENYSVTFTT